MGNICPLCEAQEALTEFALDGAPAGETGQVMLCAACQSAMNAPALNSDYWRVLTTTMWSEITTVKVIAYRLLKQLSQESWAQEALDMFYLEDDLKNWAETGIPQTPDAPTRDSNGTVLQAGDNVTLIKDLPVKGAGFTAKRGTMVRGISLTDNPEHIEGRVNGQHIVLVAAYLKKSN